MIGGEWQYSVPEIRVEYPTCERAFVREANGFGKECTEKKDFLGRRVLFATLQGRAVTRVRKGVIRVVTRCRFS